jgi:hypothetical protein
VRRLQTLFRIPSPGPGSRARFLCGIVLVDQENRRVLGDTDHDQHVAHVEHVDRGFGCRLVASQAPRSAGGSLFPTRLGMPLRGASWVPSARPANTWRCQGARLALGEPFRISDGLTSALPVKPLGCRRGHDVGASDWRVERRVGLACGCRRRVRWLAPPAQVACGGTAGGLAPRAIRQERFPQTCIEKRLGFHVSFEPSWHPPADLAVVLPADPLDRTPDILRRNDPAAVLWSRVSMPSILLCLARQVQPRRCRPHHSRSGISCLVKSKRIDRAWPGVRSMKLLRSSVTTI